MVTYRLYLEVENEQDYLSAIGGYDEEPLILNASSGFVVQLRLQL